MAIFSQFMAEKLTLTELQLLIRDTLYLSLPQMFWVSAEISEITVNASGHCYLELVEKNQEEKNVRARVRGIIWSSRFGFVKSFFENMTGETLKPGLKILVKAKVEYHEVYGLSLIISDIDPAFTMGEMALRRQLIIRRLEDEGVFSMNRDLEFPVLPQRIAIISSKNAAGYSDFINHLKGNSYGYVFYTALIDTPMQGKETEQGIISSLDRIAGHQGIFDLVVIIRGGGSVTDLSWFDSYEIAYHVTQFPLPVITGIGHEKDLSVTDMVAYDSLKTPTAVADYIIGKMSTAEDDLIELSTSLRDMSLTIIEDNKSVIEAFSQKLLPLALYMLAGNREMLTRKILDLTRSVKEMTSRSGLLTGKLSSGLLSAAKGYTAERSHTLRILRQNMLTLSLNLMKTSGTLLGNLDSSLHILDPLNVMKRGYSITTRDGGIIRSKDQLKKDDIISTRFTDGSVSSKVLDKP
jgi:exodeoxyribonuclease VII large subunit